jgi:drug/metabolite transporter (DMT)-like permease
MSLRYWLLIIFLGIAWGCSFFYNAILIKEISPLWVSALRVSLGAAVCWVYLLGKKKPLPRGWAIYAQLLVLAILNYALPFALFPFAEETVASGLVAVFNGLTPMTTVIVSQFWAGGEKATWNKMVGVALGFAGAVALALPSMGVGASGQILGLLAAFSATICYAVALNYARRFAKLEPSAVAASTLSLAALVAVPTAFLFSGVPHMVLPESYAALFGLGVVSTGFTFLIMYWLLPRVGATNISLNAFIIPITGIVLGVSFLHERFEPVHIIGIALIFAGMIFMDGRLVRRKIMPA